MYDAGIASLGLTPKSNERKVLVSRSDPIKPIATPTAIVSIPCPKTMLRILTGVGPTPCARQSLVYAVLPSTPARRELMKDSVAAGTVSRAFVKSCSPHWTIFATFC
jgi:hypothetical protein